MLSTSLLLVSTVVSLGPHPAPSFPKDWTSSIQNDIMISQGEYSAVKGGSCCPKNVSGCQLQAIFDLDKVEESGTLQKVRSATECTGGSCILMSLWGDINKQIMVAPANASSPYDFVCAEYCPLSGPFKSEVEIGPDPSDPNGGKVFYLGKDKVTQEGEAAETRVCDHYRWSEMILKLIPFQTTDFYVDSSAYGSSSILC